MLSKSKITRGVQCHKSLWLYKHKNDLRHVDTSQQAVFDSGTNVGLLAQQKFPNGVDATEGFDWPNFQTAKKTRELIAKGQQIIYEATFVYDDILVAVDILAKNNDGTWDVYEVKSSTGVKDPHFLDTAVQYYVMIGCGLDIALASILHLNKHYIRQGEVDLHQLFAATDITEEIIELQPKLPEIVEELKAVERLEECPTVDIGPHCSNPYGCDFMAHCWNHVPENSVFNLSRAYGRDWELYEKGIVKIEDIPLEYPMGDSHRIQHQAELTGKPYIIQEAVRDFVSEIKYPVYHFDFETIMDAVPLFDNTRPYQQIPFQYSVHIEEEDGIVSHKEFLPFTLYGTVSPDPREELINQLLKDLGNEGTILVYNWSFEKGRIKELARDFPQYAKNLLALNERMMDLIIPFRKKFYYTKEMQGSASIKKVLPALVPELSYDDLAIAEGGTASNTFLQMQKGNYEGDYEETHNHLLKYCELDTWAMVKILEVLKKV